jgi:hypothetical protein
MTPGLNSEKQLPLVNDLRTPSNIGRAHSNNRMTGDGAF